MAGAGQEDAEAYQRVAENGGAIRSTGIGKPEPLRGDLSGFWSRRIDDANRLVYEATDEEIRVIACRYHYVSN